FATALPAALTAPRLASGLTAATRRRTLVLNIDMLLITQPGTQSLTAPPGRLGDSQLGLRHLGRIALRQLQHRTVVLHEAADAKQDRCDGTPGANPQVQL